MQKLRDLLRRVKPTGTARIDKVLDVLVSAVQELTQGVDEVHDEETQVLQTINGLEQQRRELSDKRRMAERVRNNIRTLMGDENVTEEL